jgi:type II secretory pathway pseudopilin PulG
MKYILVLVAVLLALLVVPVYLRSRDTQSYWQSENVMYRNRAVLELYFREHGRYPAAPASGMWADLQPELDRGGRRTIAIDGWDEPLRYVASRDGSHYLLISPGKDGIVQYDPKAPLPREEDISQDVVVADGEFFYVFHGRTYCPKTVKTTESAYLECEARSGKDCTDHLKRECYEYDSDPGVRTTTAPRYATPLPLDTMGR